MHRPHNGLRTAALLGLLCAVLLLAGRALAGTTGLLVALVVALGVNGYCYLCSDRLALRSMRAYPVSQVQQPQLYAVVAELAAAMRLPMPRLYLSPTAAPNAFATGRDPRHAAVCCTEGILALLDERELRGVLGHELAHVGNRDILLSSVAGALAAVIMVLAQVAAVAGGLSREEDREGGLVGTLLLAVLGPLAATLVQLAVSRDREYRADATGARVTGDPLALAAALRKLDAGTREWPLVEDARLVATSALMIANPFAGGIGRLLRTHPPMAERVARLEALAGYRR